MLFYCFIKLVVIVLQVQSLILTDQFGYSSGEKKVAIIKIPVQGEDADSHQSIPGESFIIRDMTNDEVVFEGDVEVWKNGNVHEQSGDRIWHLDFSGLTDSGLYRIEEPASERVSHKFEIRENPWKNVLKAAMRTFFYQRSGFEKKAGFAGENWADAAAYLQEKQTKDYFDQNNPDRIRNLYGGWFDAGDFNKYVTFSSGTVHPLLTAYRLNPEVWTDDYNIPKSENGHPDILDELKWELNWILRMQEDDGGVIIKMGAREYYSASPPSTDNRDRFYGRVSTSSTIAFASMAAHAALVYRDFPGWQDYADTLERAAIRAWEYFIAQETLNTDSDQGEIKAGDADRSEESQLSEEALFAIYMFALTGDTEWNDLVRETYRRIPLFGWWGPYNHNFGEGLLFYTTLDGADEIVRYDILENFRAKPAPFYGNSKEFDPYFGGMPDSQYHWGSLSVMANTGVLNLNVVRYLDEADKESYRRRAQNILHYIHGRNPLDKCYLSNMYAYGAENPVNEFYHGWFKHGSPWQNVLFSEKGGPAPGFLVGGPNQAFTGDENPHLELNQPPQKMYADFNDGGEWPVQYNPWEITENSISYQAAYVRLLSEFVSLSSDTLHYAATIPYKPDEEGNDELPEEFKLGQNYPNPFNHSTIIQFELPRTATVTITAYNISGQKIATLLNEVRTPGTYSVPFDASGLASGIYMYRLKAGDYTKSLKMTLLK